METPDTRLVALHAENGSPHARLSNALATLEGADWGLMLYGEAGLARQLAALLGPGTLRVDPRLSLSRDVFAAYGLALATIDADWRGAKAVWLLEPAERDYKRATRSSVPIIADSTLAPGGGWLAQGVQYLVYRDGATLSGFGDLELSAIFGKGKAPVRAAPAPSDLSLAMVLRDLATMPLRLARAARTTEQLAEQLGGAAQNVGPTALLLAPDSAANTQAPLGGVLAAALAVPAGTLITPGVQTISASLALLRQDLAQELAQQQANQSQQRPTKTNDPKLTEPRPAEGQPDDHSSEPAAPQQQRQAPARDEQRRAEPTPEALGYTPEIVFSNSLRQHSVTEGSANLTQISPVSSGPDAPDINISDTSISDVSTSDISAPVEHEPPLNEQPAPKPAPPAGQRQQSDSQPPDKQQAVKRQDRPSRGEQRPRPGAASTSPTRPPAGSTSAPPEPAAPEDLADPEDVVTLPPDLPEAGTGSDVISGLNEEQQRAFERLRDWRNAEAKRLGMSRFIVASNAGLADIVRQMPRSEEELRQIRGMGPERVRKYGAVILEILRG